MFWALRPQKVWAPCLQEYLPEPPGVPGDWVLCFRVQGLGFRYQEWVQVLGLGAQVKGGLMFLGIEGSHQSVFEESSFASLAPCWIALKPIICV